MGSLKDYLIKRVSKECWPLGGDLCGTLSIVPGLGMVTVCTRGSLGGGLWGVMVYRNLEASGMSLRVLLRGAGDSCRVTSVLLGFGVSSEPCGAI